MKVSGTGQPPIPDPSAAEAAEKAAKLNETARPGESTAGKAFGEKLAGIGPAERALPTASPAGGQAPRAGEVSVHDVAADLRAGRLTPEAALDRVLERVVARQVGPDAPPAVRDQVRVTLRDAIESDPLLAEKLARLR